MNPRFVVAIALLAGCTERIQLVGEAIPGLIALEVAPKQADVAITDLGQPLQTVAYSAIGHFRDGTSRDVTALVDWSTDNPAPGSFAEPGTYRTSGAAAGHVRVAAASGDVVDDAQLTIVVTATIIDGAFPPPAGTAELFASGAPVAADPMRSPSVLYPANDTMFPRGLARILFQYSRGMMNDAFKLTFDSDVLHLTVLSGSDRWQPDDAVWSLIADSHGGSSVAFAVHAGATAMPGTIYPATPTILRFTRSSPGGVIYYFSAATTGVMRAQLGTASAGKLVPPDGDGRCAACHAVSRDGSTMAIGLGGEKLAMLDVATQSITSPVPDIPMGWATFSPDGALLLVANKGVLILRDAATGAPVGPNGGKLELLGKIATHPDWSPDGSFVAVSIADTINNMDMKGGSIARIPYSEGTWGSPEILVPAGGGMNNNFFPRWSPDGQYIAYVHADSGSKNAVTAELRIVTATGGAPRTLELASHRVGAIDAVPDLGSSMPSWAPTITDGIAWLTFSSRRPYGAVRPTVGPSQIWVAGIELAGERPDPSFAGFWLPAQDISAITNNPVWAPLLSTTF